jgi:hypothetical protein
MGACTRIVFFPPPPFLTEFLTYFNVYLRSSGRARGNGSRSPNKQVREDRRDQRQRRASATAEALSMLSPSSIFASEALNVARAAQGTTNYFIYFLSIRMTKYLANIMHLLNDY